MTGPTSDSDPPLCPSPLAVLLPWYDRNRRRLPWRAEPGAATDPYRVWLSEIMLQQTTVATVKGYYGDFVARWPTVQDLGAAPLDDILQAWAGLGYYTRARNLHACARHILRDRNGRFPESEEGLRALPGIGDYTAAAIAAIAFGRRAAPVDGNIARVLARFLAEDGHGPALRARIKERLQGLMPAERPGCVVQAMMDLGASVCTPRNPVCGLCPLKGDCRAYRSGRVAELPQKPPKKEKPTRRGVVFWVEDLQGRIWMRKRPEKGLLGGMTEFPGTNWTQSGPDEAALGAARPQGQGWRKLPGKVTHTFTHFHLELSVEAGRAKGAPQRNGYWVARDAFGDQALPTLMRKVVRLMDDAE